MSSHPLISSDGRITGSCLDDRMGSKLRLIVSSQTSPQLRVVLSSPGIQTESQRVTVTFRGLSPAAPSGDVRDRGKESKSTCTCGPLGWWVTR